MTLSLGQGHDLYYLCPCGQIPRSNLGAINRRNWTCNTCHNTVKVYMDDQNGRKFTVERRMAKHVTVHDHVVYRCGAGLASGDIRQSQQYGAKASNWLLVIQGYNKVVLPASDYVNVEVNTFVQVLTSHAGQTVP
ncbi:hypothetical protein ACIPZC_25610 [Pseudomonas sp. NPDC089743]|uniref:hypothetical protein n=1 Tax=Pseudomonas sp. NPDC089743 TaxID=3364471 RepID=UPI00380D3FDF